MTSFEPLGQNLFDSSVSKHPIQSYMKAGVMQMLLDNDEQVQRLIEDLSQLEKILTPILMPPPAYTVSPFQNIDNEELGSELYRSLRKVNNDLRNSVAAIELILSRIQL